jgi:hypothetical protein
VLAYAQQGLPPADVPEPASLSLLAAGALGAFLARRRAARAGR